MKRKRNSKLKANNFERNDGLLLKQKNVSSKNNKTEKIIIFNSDELDKATKQYNEDRILGRGGQGMVYKDMLNDGKIVAIKKSESMDESVLDVLINEYVAWSPKFLCWCMNTCLLELCVSVYRRIKTRNSNAMGNALANRHRHNKCSCIFAFIILRTYIP
ncbi:Wall-associated receptor kinase-like 9 [Bienertia sinuspersici]